MDSAVTRSPSGFEFDLQGGFRTLPQSGKILSWTAGKILSPLFGIEESIFPHSATGGAFEEVFWFCFLIRQRSETFIISRAVLRESLHGNRSRISASSLTGGPCRSSIESKQSVDVSATPQNLSFHSLRSVCGSRGTSGSGKYFLSLDELFR